MSPSAVRSLTPDVAARRRRVIPACVHIAALTARGEPRDLAGGLWNAPEWFIAALGGAIVVGAVGAIVARVLHARRKARGDHVPRSRRRW
jgi:hypothetical protein